MKGTVVSTWVESSRRLYGDEVVNEALQKNNLESNHIFTPLEDVEDRVATGIVDYIGQMVGKNHEEIWFTMGEENIKTFSKNYPGFFRHETAYQFLKSMNDVHKIVVQRIKGAVPPILDMENISSREVYFTYRSKRGMGDYLVGLVSGVGNYFNEHIKTEILKRENDEILLKLTFEKEIEYVKKYPINRLFSFGFIKKTSLKSTIFNTLLVTIVAYFTTAGAVETLILGGSTFLISLCSSILFNRPRKLVLQELKKLSDRNYAESVVLRSNDEYEFLMNEINEVKNRIQKDFIGFNSIVDEMYTFNVSVSKIAKTMEDASNEITEVLEQVAGAAMTQAGDTEQAINVLDGSIKNVTKISDDGQENKNQIEEAVVSIEQSFNNVKLTASEINQVLHNFNDIRQSSNQLKENANDITQIVSIVSAIANQINLLALNASIEAARAGEAGKGFAVVADEVKNLSGETNQAVGQINSSLTNFITSISDVVESIDVQYVVLEKENRKLKDAVETSSDSNSRLKVVSDMMIQTSQDLKVEADHISTLFDGIQNLSVIAEENSASTQEASSNVTVYVDQIHALTDRISVFESMIKNFQEDLSKYRV